MRRAHRVVDVAGLAGVIAERARGAGDAVPGVVVVDAEGVAAQQGHVVRFAGMHFGVEGGGVSVARRQAGDVRRQGRIHHLGVVLVLLEDDEDVRVARHALDGGLAGPGGASEEEGPGRQGQGRHAAQVRA